MEHTNQKPIQAVRLRRINIALIAVAAVLVLAVVLLAIDTQHNYKSADEATNRYIAAQRSASNLREGSDYLTERVRSFVVGGKAQAITDYFEEIDSLRRENAITQIEQIVHDNEAIEHLHEALRLSNDLAEIELYAMRLSIEAHGESVTDYPPALQAVQLLESDLALSKEEQDRRSDMLLFDDTYQLYKREINENVAACETLLIAEVDSVLQSSILRLRRDLLLQTVTAGLLILSMLAVALCTYYLMIRPIESVVSSIPQGREVAEQGSYELRYLVRAYNSVFTQTKANQDRLTYEATHDHLTGLYNRAVFEEQRNAYGKRSHTMLIFDVDSFKQFNDTYGHEMGDSVLKKVSAALTASFRAEDYVCRIGGDEFAAILLHTNSSMRAMIENKLERIRARLADTSDGLPVITLSIGVAFCDAKHETDDLYKNADAALYDVKERGRNGYAFYDDVKTQEDPVC